MKRLRYKNKQEKQISIDEVPQGFTPTHVFEYKFIKGKLKTRKRKLTKQEIKKLKDERKES